MRMPSPTLPSRTRGPLRKLPLLAVLCSTATLGGCPGTSLPGSVAGGECRVFERPPYAVLGKTRYDQHVADTFVESGVGGCGWQRPAKRPASLDVAPGQKVAAVAAPKKRGLFKRIRDRLTTKKEPVPFLPPEAPPAPIAVVPAPVPPPRDPVDELLHPRR